MKSFHSGSDRSVLQKSNSSGRLKEKLPRGRSKLTQGAKSSPRSIYPLAILMIFLDEEVSYDMTGKEKKLAESSNEQSQS